MMTRSLTEVSMPVVFEGVWEDQIAKHDLRGRTVRIEIVDPTVGETPWFKKLSQWVDENKVPGCSGR